MKPRGELGIEIGVVCVLAMRRKIRSTTSHTLLFPHYVPLQDDLSGDAARGEAPLFLPSRSMFVRSQNKTHFGDLLNEQYEDADPDLHQSAVCRDLNGP